MDFFNLIARCVINSGKHHIERCIYGNNRFGNTVARDI